MKKNLMLSLLLCVSVLGGGCVYGMEAPADVNEADSTVESKEVIAAREGKKALNGKWVPGTVFENVTVYSVAADGATCTEKSEKMPKVTIANQEDPKTMYDTVVVTDNAIYQSAPDRLTGKNHAGPFILGQGRPDKNADGSPTQYKFVWLLKEKDSATVDAASPNCSNGGSAML